MPGSRLPFRRLHTIRSFSLDGVEHDPVRIVRDIVLFTLAIEGLGALALSVLFSRLGVPDAVFAGVFHSISAFCNAGFSVFADGMRGMSGEPAVLLVIVALVVTGGIGFIVLSDAARVLTGRKRSLAYHSRLMLCVTAVLIAVGTLSFWLLERTHAFAGMAPLDRAVNALFQSVTPRTAGFDTVAQSSLSTLSKFLVVIFMFIGGAPGSIAGGIKISTAFVVVLFMLKQVNEQGEINSLGRRFTPRTINAAVTYFVKAAFLVVLASGLLSLSEGPLGARFDELFFEAVSAFGTVGLSLGLTPSLSIPGKAVIIGTMFIGRVGLLAYLFVAGRERVSSFVYPEASVLIG